MKKFKLSFFLLTLLTMVFWSNTSTQAQGWNDTVSISDSDSLLVADGWKKNNFNGMIRDNISFSSYYHEPVLIDTIVGVVMIHTLQLYTKYGQVKYLHYGIQLTKPILATQCDLVISLGSNKIAQYAVIALYVDLVLCPVVFNPDVMNMEVTDDRWVSPIPGISDIYINFARQLLDEKIHNKLNK